MERTLDVALIPGDGIGPEITEAMKRVLAALGDPFRWRECSAGERAFVETGTPLPQVTVDLIKQVGLALKGPLATPSGGGYRSATVQMREAFELFVNVRPAKTIVDGSFKDVDIILVRENLQGLYAAQEEWIPSLADPHAVAVATAFNTKENLERLLRYAADMAIQLGRKRITVVHKANILKKLTGIFLEAKAKVESESDYFGRVVFDDMIVDACAMKLVMKPQPFDMIVTTNLFGDILSDLIAGLVGGLGLAPGVNIGDNIFLGEAVHGTAPDIAGQDLANPSAMLLAAAMLLDHVDMSDKAERLRFAIQATIASGEGTLDVGGKNGTRAYTEALMSRLSS